jgi:hypothetical protein
MAVLLINIPSPHIYTRTMLHGIGRAQTNAEMWDNLRLIAAVLLARWCDTGPDLTGVRGHIFDVLTSEFFYQKGYAKTKFGEHDDRLWFCGYIGFEKVTSLWAKKNYPKCHGYICMRVHNQDDKHREQDNHTILFYF